MSCGNVPFSNPGWLPTLRSQSIFREATVASIEYVDVRKGMVLVGDDGQLDAVPRP